MGNAIQQSDSEDIYNADEAWRAPGGSMLRQGLPGFCHAPSFEHVHRDAVIIFDWDDTLMCSSAIKESPPPSDQELLQLGEVVSRVLRKAIELGRTAIVTNANLVWVQSSASLFLPAVLPLLQFVQVLSARQSYQERWPGDFDKWKLEAFRDVVAGRAGSLGDMARLDEMNEFVEDEIEVHSWQLLGCDVSVVGPDVFEDSCNTNLVVLGDSMVEMRAGTALVNSVARSWRSNTIVKTVKFKAVPSVHDLLGQLQAVALHLESIVEEEQNLYKKLVHGNACGWVLKDQ